MSKTGPPNQRSFDKNAATHHIERLSRNPQCPWLNTEVARRMAERLPLFRLAPKQLIDWWAIWGGSAQLLKQAYPDAHYVGIEPSPQSLNFALSQSTTSTSAAWWNPVSWGNKQLRWYLDHETPPKQFASSQLIWANMMLHAIADPLALFIRWHQLLSDEGLVMFSCLGPGSLAQLRELFAATRWGAAHCQFVDMHDLGDMLIEAGFVDPVMDQETLTLTWKSPHSLLAELRQWGGNVSPERFQGLRTPRWLNQLLAAWQASLQSEKGLSLTLELIYGHAFRAPVKVPVRPQTNIPIDTILKMLRRSR